jgi:hypothetical protein
MQRRTFLQGVAAGVASTIAPVALPHALYALETTPARGFFICVPRNAPALLESAHALAATRDNPILSALGEGTSVKVIDTQSLLNKGPTDLAYNHLLILGDMQDPLIQEAWQREARATADGMYIFGIGYLKGDIGYIESDRNPFLHSQKIAYAPYETQAITITGTNQAGILLAVRAFVERSLVNGVVASQGWSRPSTTLLDRDPLQPRFTVPSQLTDRIGDSTRIGITQATEDEYRGVLTDTGLIPRTIWRAKYYKKGNWDTPKAAGSFDNYMAGLHRRAYGNTVWLAQFSTPAEAASAAPKIAAAARLPFRNGQWTGEQPDYSTPGQKYEDGKTSPGTLTLTHADDWVMMTAMQRRTI